MGRILILTLLICFSPFYTASAAHDYANALQKSILYFQAQRSGYLPEDQKIKWRGNSGLLDGKANGIDLVGGYYDAGDNVKFGLPMAFTITMMSWGIMEYSKQMAASGELSHAMEAVKWGTDYFIKAHPEPYVLYGEVGDGKSDHKCWQRPEDMTTDRKAYKIDANNPGSDLAGETAAAMAAASIVFRRSDPAYSKELLSHAVKLFEFADRYRGKYDSSIPVVQKFYRSFSGFKDELLWAAAWLHEATNEPYYLDYLANNGDSLGGTGWDISEFSWDVKYAGVQVLVSKFLLQGKAGEHQQIFEKYRKKADNFMCSCVGKGTKNVQRTPGGLIYRQRWNNLQYATSASFLLTVFSDYLQSAGQNSVQCSSGSTTPSDLLGLAKSQVDYILGDNPRGTSYMVGYGRTFPQHVHHRGSSIVSIHVDNSFVGCRDGYAAWFSRKDANPNLLDGAVVGGPDANDNFADEREHYEQTEPATYNNAPLVGVLARLHAGNSGVNQLLVNDVADVPAEGRKSKKPTRTQSPPWPATADVPAEWRKSKKPTRKQSPPSPVTADVSPLSVTQTSTESWKDKGRNYRRYKVVVTNNDSSKTAKDVYIEISNIFGPVYWVERLSRKSYYRVPSLLPGQSFSFEYFHAAGQASVSITGYVLV